jgi:hypothetical protein
MDYRGFRLQRLAITGIDNQPVLAANKPEMAEEEYCLFHRSVIDGDAYLDRIHVRIEQAMAQKLALPVVRFADGEYAFYYGSLDCNGLYRQAESVQHIKKALPFHADALHVLAASGLAAPLVFPGNLSQRKKGFFSFMKNWRGRPSASSFLAFLDQQGVMLTGDNYLPFYVVYAYLTSRRFARTVHGKKVCILNSDSNAQAIKNWFETFSSRPDLSFVNLPAEYVATRWLSQRQAVLENIPGDTELCIVGAGIGALPVCVDVSKTLSIPAVDAGHALNMMNDRVDKSNGARLYSLWTTP